MAKITNDGETEKSQPSDSKQNLPKPQNFPMTKISLGIKVITRPTPQTIPESEVFDLESIYVLDSPEKVKGTRRCEAVEKQNEPPLFCYFDPPKPNAPEIDFNDINVFKSWKDLDALECMDPETIRSILVRPLQDFKPFTEMKMMTPRGDLVPCHLPLFGDLYGFSDVFFILLGWEMDRLSKTKAKQIVPESLKFVIDPRPVLELDGPIHDFGRGPVRIAMGSYTDAVHKMKLVTVDTFFTVRVLRSSVFVKRNDGEQRPRRWFQETVFVPHGVDSRSDVIPVKHGSTLIVWSGRGVARLSFVSNFRTIVEIYKPTIMVVLESRISQKNLVQLMDKIDEEYECGMFGTENFYGGVLFFWRTYEVELFANTNYHKGCKADVTVKGVASSKVRKCLFTEDLCSGKKVVHLN